MKNHTLAALLTTMLAASAGAQALPPPPGVPSAEAIATLPDLSATQQDELRRILHERRDALDAARDKARATREAQMRKDRDEFERIEDQSSARIRKLLGDEGFRRYAEWSLAHRGHGVHEGPGHAPHRGDARGPSDAGRGRGAGRDDTAPTPPTKS